MSARTPLRGPVPDRAAPLLTLALLCAAGAAGLYAVAVHSVAGQRADGSAFGGLDPVRNPVAYSTTRDLLETISISSVALVGLSLMAVAATRRRLDLVVGAAAIVIGANVTTQILKDRLPRPDLVVDGVAEGAGSYPSGHVTVAASLAVALVVVSPPQARALAASLGAIYAAGTGAAVLALDWHRPSDVIGAYLVAAGWGALVAALAPGTRRPEPRRRASGGLTVTVIGLFATFAAVVAIALWRRLDVLRAIDDRGAFLAASAVSALIAVLLLAALVALMRPAPRSAAATFRGAAPGG